MQYQEKQLTSDAYGHTIHNGQVFSSDNQWIVYDTRNDDTQIGSTDRIEMVNIQTGEIRMLYQTQHQTAFGPGVGAASFSPVDNRVIFIHGIRNANKEKPYSATRRTGVAIDIAKPNKPIFMDPRDIVPPYTAGALRGGTHAHSWSGDGQWISFTYNDEVFAELSKTDTAFADLRTVGVMVPGKVHVKEDSLPENNSGICFATVVAQVNMHPRRGSDEIDKAFDETWIGQNGYLKANGSRQRRAIAFQGNVRSKQGKSETEIFVLDLPDDLRNSREGYPLEGNSKSLPNVPKGVFQRRITFGAHVSGPRHWLRTTPDGSIVFYLAMDEKGTCQIFSVPTNGGKTRQITRNPFAVQGPFNVHPNGQQIAYAADNSLFVTNIFTGETQRISPKFSDKERPVGAPVYSHGGKYLAYNRYTGAGNHRFLQIYLTTLK